MAGVKSNAFRDRAPRFKGTPSYVVGADLVLGAVGLAGLKERI